MLTGALEAGGTKMMCAAGGKGGTILEQISIPTATPEETIPKLIEYFQDKGTEALGVAAFGLAGVEPESEAYGYILDTPKLVWRHRDFLGRLKDKLEVPMGLNTDVNGSCLRGVTYGCAKGLDSVIYITIGAGVGMGVCINGTLLHGVLHPEGDHVLLTRHENDSANGICPYHKNCLEGFTNGPFIEARWGKKTVELVDRPEVWEMESYYTTQALVDYIMFLSPQEIVLGGKVMHQKQLFPMIRQKVKEMLDGYIKTKKLENTDSYIVPTNLHDDQGIMGCAKLGPNALRARLPLEDFSTC